MKMADLKILIVEDEMIVAVDLKKQLEKLGYTIIDIVTNGEDAIKWPEKPIQIWF